jgi:hypothetical protein
MEALGVKIRQQRQRLGLTLAEVSGRTSISKPYLSLIENGQVSNPASDDKLRRIEQALGFAAGELITQAHLYRTPKDVRAVLSKLMATDGPGTDTDVSKSAAAASRGKKSTMGSASDPENLSGALREIIDQSAGQFGPLIENIIPVINRESSEYPDDFAGPDFPRKSAEAYVCCPDVSDALAFAARVQGESMTPKYNAEDIVIFSPAKTARDGDDCFIRFADGRTTFKRIFFESNENHQPVVRLQPRNERHRAQIVPSEKIAGMYRAVYRYQKVDED